MIQSVKYNLQNSIQKAIIRHNYCNIVRFFSQFSKRFFSYVKGFSRLNPSVPPRRDASLSSKGEDSDSENPSSRQSGTEGFNYE